MKNSREIYVVGEVKLNFSPWEGSRHVSKKRREKQKPIIHFFA